MSSYLPASANYKPVSWDQFGWIRDYDAMSGLSGSDFTVYFQNFPEETSMSASAEYNDESIALRSLPFKSYSGSSGRSLPLSLQFVASMSQADKGKFPHASERGYEYIAEVSQKLLAFVYPDYDETIRPHRIWVKAGALINFIGVMSSCSVTPVSVMSMPGNYETNIVGLPISVTVDIEIEEIAPNNKPPSASEIADWKKAVQYTP